MEDLIQLAYAVDTFYFLIMGVMVMFMAPAFAMLEAGMVRSKNTSGILVKNIGLFSIACIMYILIGYDVMYAGGMLLTLTTPSKMFWRLEGTSTTPASRTSSSKWFSSRQRCPSFRELLPSA